MEMEIPDGDGAPPPAPPESPWAEIVGDGEAAASLPIDAVVLEKLKRVVIDSVRVDEDSKERARARFQNALYGKLLGKTPPFHVVRSTLLGMWKTMGSNILLSDLPNGFILIRCESADVKAQLLLGGPWAVYGVTLQLAPWQPGFEPAFSKLSRALVCVQLHNLPVDYWDGDSLETHSASIGKLVKIDDSTTTLSRTRFARVCLEIDLAAPLKRGFWLEDGDKRTFVMVLYERAPNLCFHCGIVGHEAKSCPSRRENASEQPPVAGPNNVDIGASPCSSMPQTARCEENGLHVPLVEMAKDEDPGYGWIHPPRWRGRGRVRGGAGDSAARVPHMTPGDTRGGQLVTAWDARHVGPVDREMVTRRHVGWDHRELRGRGGSLGHDGSFHPDFRSDPSSSCYVAVTEAEACSRREQLDQVVDDRQVDGTSINMRSRGGGVHFGHGESYHHNACCAPSSPREHDGFADTGLVNQVPETRSGGDFRIVDKAHKGKGKRKSYSSPPLLLMSSMDQQPESSNGEHQKFVAQVKLALNGGLGTMNHSGSESEDLLEDLEMEDSEDDRTLWEIHKGMRKESRARKGVQILSAVQKNGRKIAKGKRK